jgi:hypothetical protein
MSKKGISDADNLLPEQYEYTKNPDNGRMKDGLKGVADTEGYHLLRSL